MEKLLELNKAIVLDFQKNAGVGYVLPEILELEEKKAKIDRLVNVSGLIFTTSKINLSGKQEEVTVVTREGSRAGSLITDSAVSQLIGRLIPKKVEGQKLTDVLDYKFLENYLIKVNAGIDKDNSYRHRHNARPYCSLDDINNRSVKEFFNGLGEDRTMKAEFLNNLIAASSRSDNQFLFRIMSAQGMNVIAALLSESYSVFDNVSLIKFIMNNFDPANWYVSKYRSDALNSNTQIRLHERVSKAATIVGDMERSLTFHNSEIGKLSYYAREGLFEHRCLNGIGNWTNRKVVNPAYISSILTPDQPELLEIKSEERIRHSHKPEDSFIESLERLLLNSGAEELRENYLASSEINLFSGNDFIDELGKSEGLSKVAIETVKVAYKDQDRFNTKENSLIRVIDAFTEAAHKEVILPSGKKNQYKFGSGVSMDLERIGSQLVTKDESLPIDYSNFTVKKAKDKEIPLVYAEMV